MKLGKCLIVFISIVSSTFAVSQNYPPQLNSPSSAARGQTNGGYIINYGTQAYHNYQVQHPVIYHSAQGAISAFGVSRGVTGVANGNPAAVPGLVKNANGLDYHVQSAYRGYFLGQNPQYTQYYPPLPAPRR